MNVLKRIFDFYINSSIHVSIAVCVLFGITLMEFHITLSLMLMFLIFFGSITGYNFVKYFTVAKLHHRSLSPFLKQIQLFSLLCFAVAIVLLLYQTVHVLYLLGLLSLITFLYTVPLLKKKNLRALQSVKIFIVALVWAGVTVLTPIIDFYPAIEFDHWISFVQRFLLVLVLTIPFEIRDLSYDSKKLRTFPQILGIKRSKIIGIFFLLIILIIEFFKNTISISYISSLIIIMIVTGIFLLMTKEGRSRYYTTFWVESIPMMWIMLLYLLN
jgi:hypothetical protein